MAAVDALHSYDRRGTRRSFRVARMFWGSYIQQLVGTSHSEYYLARSRYFALSVLIQFTENHFAAGGLQH